MGDPNVLLGSTSPALVAQSQGFASRVTVLEAAPTSGSGISGLTTDDVIAKMLERNRAFAIREASDSTVAFLSPGSVSL